MTCVYALNTGPNETDMLDDTMLRECHASGWKAPASAVCPERNGAKGIKDAGRTFQEHLAGFGPKKMQTQGDAKKDI